MGDFRQNFDDLVALATLGQHLTPSTARVAAKILGWAEYGGDLEEELGLRGMNGWPAASIRAIRLRDLAIRAAATFSDADSCAGQAAYVHRELNRYADARWKNDARCDVCPPAYIGTIYEFLFAAMDAKPANILSLRTIREILGRPPLAE